MIAPHPANRGFVWTDHVAPFRLVTEAQAAAFDRDGYFLLQGALDPAVVGEIEREIDPFEHESEELLRREYDGHAGPARADEITFTIQLADKSDTLRKLVSGPPFVDLVLDLVGPDARLYWDQSVYKKPESPRDFPWHQDNGYTFIEPQDYLTCWIPLTKATVDNGCPWVWPGMHRHGTLAHRESPLGFVCKEDDEGSVPVEAGIGDIVVFSSLTPHRTGPNTTDAVRKAYIVQYSHADARGTDGTLCDAPFQFPVVRDGEPVA